MLKKLVKYGNSNALVLDKALLELLNIEEGSIVKIKTDGNSLIITPHNQKKAEAISETIDPQKSLEIASVAGWSNLAPEKAEQYLDETKQIMARYKPVLKKLTEPAAEQAMLALSKKYNSDHHNPDYIKDMIDLRNTIAPDLKEFDKELEMLGQKYQLKYDQTRSKQQFKVIEFKKIHERYKHIHEEILKLKENPDYIHESVVLAEKYKADKRSPEYLEEYAQLIAKYIPDYTNYLKEIKELGPIA